MELLFRRKQTTNQLGRVNFSLWSMIALDEDEKAIVKRYKFDEAILIEAIQPYLLRKTVLIGAGAFVLVFAFLALNVSAADGLIWGFIAGGGSGYWYFHQKRETIYVRDLIHGRYFTCSSVIELARKEAWLGEIVGFLRQVMESAKHWDGTERHTIKALSKEEARTVILRGI